MAPPRTAPPADLGDALSHGTLDGPWEQAFWMNVPFAFASKSNHRHDRAGRADWARIAGFEGDLHFLARQAVPDGWELGDGVELAKRPVVVAVFYAATKLDALNLSKSAADAVEGVVVLNDASIAWGASGAYRGKDRDGGLIAFARLAPGTSTADAALACAALVEQVAGFLRTGLPDSAAHAA